MTLRRLMLLWACDDNEHGREHCLLVRAAMRYYSWRRARGFTGGEA